MNPSNNPDKLAECLSSFIESIQRLKALTPIQNVVRHAELDLMAGMNALFMQFHQQINGQASTGPQEPFTTLLQSVFSSTSNGASTAPHVAAGGNSGSGSSGNFPPPATPSSIPALQLQEQKMEEEETKGRKKRSRKSRSDAEQAGTKVYTIWCFPSSGRCLFCGVLGAAFFSTQLLAPCLNVSPCFAPQSSRCPYCGIGKCKDIKANVITPLIFFFFQASSSQLLTKTSIASAVVQRREHRKSLCMKLVKQWVVEGRGSGLPTIQELNALRGKKICLPLISRKVF